MFVYVNTKTLVVKNKSDNGRILHLSDNRFFEIGALHRSFVRLLSIGTKITIKHYFGSQFKIECVTGFNKRETISATLLE